MLQIVDLAGSERNKKSHASGKALKEAININVELFYLGNIISILSDDSLKKCPYLHVPFKNSKLTRILENSIGKNSITLMITCIGAGSNFYYETINTLRFAQKAKKVINKPIINLDVKSKIILELKNQINHLREIINLNQLKKDIDSDAVTCNINQDKKLIQKGQQYSIQNIILEYLDNFK